MKIPSSVKNVDYKRHLRRSGEMKRYADYRSMWLEARGIAEKALKNKSTAPSEVRESKYFTNDQVWEYYEKQIHIVEVHEKLFADAVDIFLKDIEEKAISNLPKAVAKSAKKEFVLFEVETEIKNGIDMFTPLQEEIAGLSAMEAFAILNMDTAYVPSEQLEKTIRTNVERFATSIVDTDKEKLTQILSSGLQEGQGVAQLTQVIQTQFGAYRKVQAERIVRSEVLRASNAGAVDAWEASGVVVGKQWLTAKDSRTCPYCAPMNGKIIGLRKVFFRKGQSYLGDAETPIKLDYSSVDEPPLHVSCRCTVIPVLQPTRAVPGNIEKMKADLESWKAYANNLEELLEIDDE